GAAGSYRRRPNRSTGEADPEADGVALELGAGDGLDPELLTGTLERTAAEDVEVALVEGDAAGQPGVRVHPHAEQQAPRVRLLHRDLRFPAGGEPGPLQGLDGPVPVVVLRCPVPAGPLALGDEGQELRPPAGPDQEPDQRVTLGAQGRHV